MYCMKMMLDSIANKINFHTEKKKVFVLNLREKSTENIIQITWVYLQFLLYMKSAFFAMCILRNVGKLSCKSYPL